MNKKHFWTPASLRDQLSHELDVQFLMRDQLEKATEPKDIKNWKIAIQTNCNKVKEILIKLSEKKYETATTLNNP